MKVIIDCNVLIAADIKDGLCRSVLKYVAQNCKMYISRDIILEYLLVSRRSKFQDHQQYLEKLIELISNVVIVQDPHSIDVTIPDMDDKKYIDLAIEVRADFLITGNLKHFPEGKYGKTQVTSPNVFSNELIDKGN